MKKIILALALILISATTFSQRSIRIKIGSSTDADNSEIVKNDSVSVSFYLSASLSIANTHGSTFSQTAYPSLEFGGMYDNFGLGLVVGHNNFYDFKNDNMEKYWYELKTSFTQPIGPISVYGLFGVGNYLSTNQWFIEYGIGMSATFNKVSIFIQSSNWDGIDYISPGLTYNF